MSEIDRNANNTDTREIVCDCKLGCTKPSDDSWDKCPCLITKNRCTENCKCQNDECMNR